MDPEESTGAYYHLIMPDIVQYQNQVVLVMQHG